MIGIAKNFMVRIFEIYKLQIKTDSESLKFTIANKDWWGISDNLVVRCDLMLRWGIMSGSDYKCRPSDGSQKWVLSHRPAPDLVDATHIHIQG